MYNKRKSNVRTMKAMQRFCVTGIECGSGNHGLVSSHHESPAKRGGRGGVRLNPSPGQPTPSCNFMTSCLLKSKPNAGQKSSSELRLRRSEQTRNGFGQSYVRPVASAPLRTASVDRVAERASRPLPRPAWQIFSKAYHHRRCVPFLCFL